MLKRFIAVAFLIPGMLWLISWEYGSYPKYCEEVDKCPEHNLLIYGWLAITDFIHQFESFFIVIFTLAIAFFTYQLKAATISLDKSTKRLWRSGKKQIALAGRQTDLAEKQHGLQREEFFATHRPRISISRIQITPV